MLHAINLTKKIISMAVLLFAQCALALGDPWRMNMHEGVTPISKDMYFLHMVAIAVCAGIGLVVFGVMFYALFHHRKSRGYKAASFHENIHIEILWTLIPFIILIGLAIPATRILMRMDDSSNADVTIKIVGYQWKWQYTYLDEGISFFSSLSTPFAQIHNQQKKNPNYLLEVDHPMVIPVNKKVRFLVTSNDVVHSWWVPELGIKRDAIPGFIHEAWARIEKPGTYRGQCTELCGVYHGFMPIVVNAVSNEDYAKWVLQQQNLPQVTASNTMTREALMTLGKEKYEAICSACHQPDGRGIPPLYPALRGSSIAVGHPIARHIELVLYGVAGSAMQSYKDQLSDEEIAAIITYERNAWENNTEDEIQPEDVQRIRQTQIQQPIRVKQAHVGEIQ